MRNKLIAIIDEITKVKATLRFAVLLIIAFVLYYFYKAYIIIDVSTNQNTSQTTINNIVWVFLCAIIIIGVLVVVSFIWDHLVSRKSDITDNLNTICKECVQGKISRELSLETYGLLKKDELVNKIEKGLSKDDEIIIYTSLAETENDVEDVVKENSINGVIYHLLYYKDFDNIDEHCYKNIIKLTEFDYGKGIDFELSKDTGFDFFTLKKHNEKLAEAYFAVNYSVGSRSCIRNAKNQCDNPCDKRNEYLFYKKIDEQIADAVFEKLKTIVKTYESNKVKDVPSI